MPELFQKSDFADGDLLSSPLPCLLVGHDGMVLDASPAATRLCRSPSNRPLTDAFGISPEALAENLASGGQRALVGKCIDADDYTNYVLAQAAELPERSATLLVLTDLRSSRKAEEDRFEVTPYPVLRLSVDGRIVFSNEAAKRTLGANLTGQLLPDIFPAVAQADLIDVLKSTARESRGLDLPAPDALQSSKAATEVRLFLMPDFGPADYLIGRIAVISWDPHDKYRDRISAAIHQGKGWESAFRLMLDALGEAVPYDRAVFGVFSEDGTRYRAMLVHPEPDPPWPRRWVNVPRQRYDRLAKGLFIDRNWAESVKGSPELLTDPTVERSIEGGINTVLVVPVGQQGKPDGVLSLSSRNEQAFDGQALPLISALRIESNVATLLRMAERDNDAAIARIGNEIVKASSIETAIGLLLSGLVKQFQWDHAAIYFADPTNKCIRLAHQYPRLDELGDEDRLAMPSGYTQPLDRELPEQSGMLGATFFSEQALVVEDVLALGAEGKPPYHFHAPDHLTQRRSAMTVPVWVNREIRWLLDIESLTTHAFGEEDKRQVGRVVRDLEQRMALLSERILSVELLNIIEQGTVIADVAGRILRANRKAKDMLRLASAREHWGRISDYGADEPARKILAGHTLVERESIRICGPEGGVGNAVLVSRRDFDRGTGDSVWLFTDLRVDEWQYDSRYIENTIREVARQARGPLMLAASFVKRIAEGAVGGDLASRAVAELGKADLTYQRISDSVEARKAPRRDRYPVPLRKLLADLYKGLPQWDADQIRLLLPREALQISGDGGRIELALSVTVAFFLAQLRHHTAGDKTIDLKLSRRTGMAVIAFAFRNEKSGARLVKLRASRGAPLETASIIVVAHGGRMVGAGLDSHTPRIEIRLPLLSETGDVR